MLGGMGHHKQVHSAPEGADVNLGAWLVGWWGCSWRRQDLSWDLVNDE